jgi:prefoldin subunit 5
MLEGGNEAVRRALDQGDGDGADSGGAVTDRLLEDDDTVTCWTCGSSVRTPEIESTVDLLKELRADTAREKDEVTDAIDRLQEEVESLERRRRDVQQYERRLERIDDEIESREERVASLGDRRDELEAEIETVQAEIDDLRSDQRNELLDLHERANDVEYELGRLQTQREAVESEIDEIETTLADADDLETERESVQSELVELRTRIDRIQEAAVEEFNQQMETVLELLEYDNLDWVWIERTETTVRDGRGTSTKPVFDLHVIRNPEGGPAYEDEVDHLSESEREVIGLVALAGYFVHDVHEECPFILLGSLEALDSGRIAALVDYVESYADSLVIALLPEDAQAFDASYQRVSEI